LGRSHGVKGSGSRISLWDGWSWDYAKHDDYIGRLMIGMKRELLTAEAMRVANNSNHNLQVIRKNPTKMLPGKIENAEAYLNMMIRFAEVEIENARRLGRTQLRTRLKNLVTSILTLDSNKGKGETA